jgi:hypothetical protein
MEAATMMERQREQVEKRGRYGKGRSELLKHLDSEPITMRQAILAKCYDCMGYYCDGKIDCRLPACSLYPFMPYREEKPDLPKKHLSDEEKAVLTGRLKKVHQDRHQNTPTFELADQKSCTARNYLSEDDTTPVSGVPDRLSTGKHTLQTKDVSEGVSVPGTGPQNTPTFELASLPARPPGNISPGDDRR